jgi:putative oxidoreductase
LRFLDRLQPVALLALRVAIAIVLIAHGKAKVFGGMHEHLAMVASLGLPAWMGYLSAGTEFFGGILLLVGFLTRFVGVAVTIEMLVAIFKVHVKNGIIGTPQAPGYQLPLLVCAIGFALIWLGAGPISLDWLFAGHKGRKR